MTTYKDNYTLEERKRLLRAHWKQALNWCWFQETFKIMVTLQLKKELMEIRWLMEFLAEICLTVDPEGLWIHTVVISPGLECVIGINVLKSWQNSHIGFLTHGEWDIMLERLCRNLYCCLCQEKSWLKNSITSLDEIQKLVSLSRTWKMHVWCFPPYLPLTSNIWLVKTTEVSWRITTSYQNLNQIVNLIAAVVPDMVSLLE